MMRIEVTRPRSRLEPCLPLLVGQLAGCARRTGQTGTLAG
jgi:hypothetical protein